MRNLKKVVISIKVRNETVAGIIPINNVVVVPPGIPAGHQVHVEAVGEDDAAGDVLPSQAMERLGSVQNGRGVVLVGRSGFEPAAIFETWTFKIFAEHVAGGAVLRARRIG